MRKRTRYVLIGTTVAAVVAAGTLTADAAWVIGGSAQVKTRTAKTPKGTKPSVAKQSKTAVVSWSAQELVPGVKMDRYIVTAHSQDTPAKAAIVREVEATGGVSETVTFAAAEVAGGKWKWAVIPRYAHWAGAEGSFSAALTFPAAAPAAKVAGAPAPETATPATAPAETPPTPEATKKPAAEPVVTTPAPLPEKTEDDTAPPPASPSAVQEPDPTAPEPSASGSADEGIPK